MVITAILYPNHLGDYPLDKVGVLVHPKWLSFCLEESDMIRMNPYYFYYIGMVLHPLAGLQIKDKSTTVLATLYSTESALDQLLSSTIIPLRTCKNAGSELRTAISSTIAKLTSQPDQEVTLFEIVNIRRALERFETVLAAELQTLNTYFVSQKGLYSTLDLIEGAEIIFPEKVRGRLPLETIEEIRQAGKCVAFEVSTAAGFHILRATEAVIREYYKVVVGNLPKQKSRNWGVYIMALRTHGADPKILFLLEQIKDMHRNPIMHPEDTLTNEEAITLLGIAQGVIVTMVKDMDSRLLASTASVPGPMAVPATPVAIASTRRPRRRRAITATPTAPPAAPATPVGSGTGSGGGGAP
jgi:hypothetical protein